jgi:O-antigen/teichoic acid export membrane protein
MIKNLLAGNNIFKLLLTNKAILSIIFNALGKGVYFLFVLFTGRLITADSQTDVYFFTVEFLKVFVGYSLVINSDLIIPKIINLKNKNPEETKQVIGFFYALYALLSISAAVMMYLFPNFILGFFSKFSTDTIQKDYHIFSFLIPIIFFNILSGLQSSILIAHNYFVTPALVTFIGNCISLGVLFLLHKTLGVNAAILGIMIGGISINVMLAYYLKVKCKIEYTFNLKIDWSIFSSVNYITLVYVTSSICIFALIYLLTAAPETTTTAYNYASLIAFIPHQFIGVQLLVIMGNKFAELYNKQQFALLRSYIKKTLVGLAILMLPICAFYIIFSTWVVHIVAGENVHSEIYLQKFSLLLRYMALPAFFNSIFLCGARLFIMTMRVKIPSLIQSGVNIISLFANYIGFRYFNLEGLGISIFMVYSLFFLSGVWLIYHFYKNLEIQEAIQANSQAIIVSS